MMSKLVYATRKSMLALAQSRALMALLQSKAGPLEIGEEQVVTTGDRIQDRPLSEVGGKGLFVKEIEDALLEGRADCAVHSIKDVPAELPVGLEITCIPLREAPEDALVSPRFATLANLPQGAKVGTSSLRRAVALRLVRPDLTIAPLRGNVDTRLRKVEEGEFDAIVLAAAGLRRLGYSARITELLGHSVMLPAIGQGALGVECRSDDARVKALLAHVHDIETSCAVHAERGVMKVLSGDCKTPIAAFAVREGAQMRLRAWISNPDGSDLRALDVRAPWPSNDQEAAKFGFSEGSRLLT